LQTVLRGNGAEVVIGPGRPLALIGTRIDAAKGPMAEALRRLDLARIRLEARAQADEGADVIAVQVWAEGIDPVQVLPQVVEAVAEAVPLPLCIQTESPAALAAALRVCPGKPLIGSISGKSIALNALVPLAAAHGAAVLATAVDESGIPRRFDDRIELMRNILRAAILGGVARQDVILNPGLEALPEDPEAAKTYLQAAAHLARIEQLNVALDAAAAGGQEDGSGAAQVLLALAARAGVTCALANPAVCSRISRVIDLLLARPGAAERYRALLPGAGLGN
jgi:5-methyltetrahydrofolate--homocysteine methyltransferase